MSTTKDVLAALAKIEAQQQVLISLLQQMIASRTHAVPAPSTTLPKLTTKQHAALQMLLAGASNADIADRFGVTDNTAKVHVRTIAAKLGVNTRAQIVIRAKPIVDAIAPEDYRVLSGGLPKDWRLKYRKPDPFKPLYYGGE